MKRVPQLLGLLLAGYLVVLLLVWVLQRRLLYVPPPSETPSVPGATLVQRATPSGLPVVAFHLPAAPGRMTVVHFHGNGDQLAYEERLARALHAVGLGFYGVEYPGYGLAAGAAPSEDAIYAVAEAAIDHLRLALHVLPSDVLLSGHSLGSGVAAEMAARGRGARLVLVSPYTSMGDMAARVLPFLPGRWLIRDRYDTLGKAAHLRLPTLVYHGALDDLIPLEMGRRVGAAIAGATVVVDPNAGHNDVLDEAFIRCVDRFSRGEPCDTGANLR